MAIEWWIWPLRSMKRLIKSRTFFLAAVAGGTLALGVGALLPAAPLAALVDTISVRKARELIQGIAGANLSSDQVHIKDISPGLGGGGVIVEARIETAFRMTKENGDWRIAEVRLGDRQWESFDLIEEAVRREKVRRTMLMLKELADALAAYRQEKGFFAKTDEIEKLLDYLSPRYISKPYRFDSWGKQFEYRGTETSYRLISAGPDCKPGTKDDLIIENGVIRSIVE